MPTKEITITLSAPHGSVPEDLVRGALESGGYEVRSLESRVVRGVAWEQKRPTRRRTGKPSTWYHKTGSSKAMPDKVDGDWSNVRAEHVVDWWCWRYERAFGLEDAEFAQRGNLTKGRKVAERACIDLFGRRVDRLCLYLNETVAWWRMKKDQDAKWPRGLPSLTKLLRGDTFIKKYQSGEMKEELRRWRKR